MDQVSKTGKPIERIETISSLQLNGKEFQSVIRYTIDGSLPDHISKIYKSPITLNRSTKIRARAFKKGLNPSYAISMGFKKLKLLPALHPKGLKPGLKYEYKETYALKFSDTEESPVLKTGIIPISQHQLIIIKRIKY
jgi:hypothetical protein